MKVLFGDDTHLSRICNPRYSLVNNCDLHPKGGMYFFVNELFDIYKNDEKFYKLILLKKKTRHHINDIGFPQASNN